MSNNTTSEHGLSWQVLGSGTLSITPKEEGNLYVKIVDSDGERIWTGTREWGFWESRTETGQIKNEVAQRVLQTKAEVDVELTEIWTELADRAREDDRFLVSPAVRELLSNTDRVVAHPGPEEHYDYEVVVTAKRNGTSSNPNINMDEPVTRTLTFTNTEWDKSKGGRSGPPLRKKYVNNFYGLISINWEQWREDIRPAWEEMIESRDGSAEEVER